MATPLVAVTDSVFPNLDPAREVLSKIGAELQLASEPTPEAILRSGPGRRCDPDHLRQDHRGDDPADDALPDHLAGSASAWTTWTLPRPPAKGIVVTKVPDYCIDEVSDHAMALLLVGRCARFRSPMRACTAGTLGNAGRGADSPLRGTAFSAWWVSDRIPQLVAPKAQTVRHARCGLRSVRSAGSASRRPAWRG